MWKALRPQLAAAVFCVMLFSCTGERLTQANVDQVTEGMTRKQVESILGPPTTVDSKDFLLLKRTSYVYHQKNGNVTILFKDERVVAKSSTLQK